ncbi:MAG TPA: 2-amino-4-hydroxy-6-hydroxymethyldihydropteridine diphosphokinase [Actinomycetota bacterium]
MTVAYLGLGSNLGDRAAMLLQAIEALDWGEVRVTARSSVHETEPVGGPPGQPMFLNQVIEVETTLGPRALLERCQAVESALGRRRDPGVRWGPRTIDVDILLYGSEQIDEPGLTIPHPLMTERSFVMGPLAEIAPDLTARLRPD